MKFISKAKFIEGNLDWIENPVIDRARSFALLIFCNKKIALHNQPFIAGVPKPTQAEVDAAYNSFDLFLIEETPVSRFNDAIENELKATGYTQNKGVPGIEIVTDISPKDIGPSSYSANMATITVTFTPERLQEFKDWLIESGDNLAIYHLNEQTK